MQSTDDKLKLDTLCDLNMERSSSEYILIQLSLDTEQTSGKRRLGSLFSASKFGLFGLIRLDAAFLGLVLLCDGSCSKKMHSFIWLLCILTVSLTESWVKFEALSLKAFCSLVLGLISLCLDGLSFRFKELRSNDSLPLTVVNVVVCCADSSSLLASLSEFIKIIINKLRTLEQIF